MFKKKVKVKQQQQQQKPTYILYWAIWMNMLVNKAIFEGVLRMQTDRHTFTVNNCMIKCVYCYSAVCVA